MEASEDKERSKEEFYQLMKRAVISSLSYLRKKAKKESILLLLDYDLKIDINKKSWDTFPRLRYALALFVSANLEDILKLPEVISCMDFMVNNGFHKMLEMKITDKNGKIIEDVETYKTFLGGEIVGDFLRRYVEAVNKLEYDETVFNNLYSELEEYIYSKGREIIAIAPLLNFKLKGLERINLGDFTIRKINEDEFKMLLSTGGGGTLGERHSFYPLGGSFKARWCIEVKAISPSKNRIENLTPHIEKAITALRLFKRGAVQYSAILHYQKVWRTSWGISNYRRREAYGPAYVLTSDDVKSLKTFWDKFKKVNIQNYPFLDVAIRRFNFSYERKLPEDKLIDYITAFEALYLKGVGGELGYRLALRCAYFLGKDKEERKRIFKILKSAYDIRSKIIHGVRVQSASFEKIINKLDLKSFTELSIQVEEYLRRSIKMFLDYSQSNSHEEIIKEIDERVISGDIF